MHDADQICWQWVTVPIIVEFKFESCWPGGFTYPFSVGKFVYLSWAMLRNNLPVLFIGCECVNVSLSSSHTDLINACLIYSQGVSVLVIGRAESYINWKISCSWQIVSVNPPSGMNCVDRRKPWSLDRKLVCWFCISQSHADWDCQFINRPWVYQSSFGPNSDPDWRLYRSLDSTWVSRSFVKLEPCW